MTHLFVRTLLVIGLPVMAIAANVEVTCNDVAGVTAGAITSCSLQLPSNAPIDASAVVGNPGEYSVEAEKNGGLAVSLEIAEASISGLLEVLVTGGTGRAWLAPCIFAMIPGSGGAAGASFGLMSADRDSLPCPSRTPPVSQAIPITLRVAITEPFRRIAGGGGIGGTGEAGFLGFAVLNDSDTVLSSAAVTVTDVTTPEPSTVLLLIAAACALSLAARKSWRH